MTIDDLKIDELEHFVAYAFREIDIQFMGSLPNNQSKLAYINRMLNTTSAQNNLASFRLAKLWKAVGAVLEGAVKAISDAFINIGNGLRGIIK